MSSIVAQDWRPKTLAELFVQYQARLLEDWNHTASLMSMWCEKGVPYHKLHPYLKHGSGSQSFAVPGEDVFDL